MTGTMIEEYLAAPIVETVILGLACYVVVRKGLPALKSGEGEIDERWVKATAHSVGAIVAVTVIVKLLGLDTPLTYRLALVCSLAVLAVGLCPRGGE
ncbi:hypothetical protein [Methanopyrus kandleri]